VRRVNLSVPVFLPEWAYKALREVKHKIYRPRTEVMANYSSERDVEWPFCAAHMPLGPGQALDFGCGRSPLGFLAALRGFRVTAIDLEPVWLPYSHPNLCFVQCDLFERTLPERHFDLVINCSSIEHVGLAGRYGITSEDPDGDLQAMLLLRGLMKPGAIMLLTVPVGRDIVLAPMHRVYGPRRLPRLLQGFTVEHEEYWVKEQDGRWKPSAKKEALSFQASGNPDDPLSFTNALGCFILKRPHRD